MKTNTRSTLTAASLLMLLLTSCGTIYYAPNQPNMPMVKDKGVTKVDGGFGFGEYSTVFDLGVSHSFTDHFGALANFSSLYLDGNALNSFDIGGGYFHALDEDAGFEVYSTVGYGKLKMIEYDYWSGQSDYANSSSLFRFSIQPDIFYASKHFESGFAVRIHFLDYGKTTFNSEYPIMTSNHIMFEPSLKLAVGGAKGKFTLQGTYSQKMNSGNLSYDPIIISVGFTCRIGAPRHSAVKGNQK